MITDSLGRSPTEVERALGAPTSRETVKTARWTEEIWTYPGRQVRFRDGYVVQVKFVQTAPDLARVSARR